MGVGLVAIVGVYIALNAQGVFDLLLLTMAIYVSGIFIPTMCALFWSRATTKERHGGFSGGGISVVILYGLQRAGKLPSFLEPIIGGLLVSGALMYLVSQATRFINNDTEISRSYRERGLLAQGKWAELLGKGLYERRDKKTPKMGDIREWR